MEEEKSESPHLKRVDRGITRVVKWVAIFGVLALIVLAVISYKQKNDNSKKIDKGNSVTSVPKSSPPALQPNKPPPSTSGHEPNAGKGVAAAAYAAKDAVTNLAQAMFLPPDMIRQVVSQLVIPQEVDQLVNAYQSIGKFTAEKWRYTDVDEARQYAQYNVSPAKWRAASFNGKSATIYVYTLTNYYEKRMVSQFEASYLPFSGVPRIRVVRMKYLNDKWLFVSARDPDPGESPRLRKSDSKRSTDELQARFKRYLKGYHDYVYKNK
jgi:hypothetical protein